MAGQLTWNGAMFRNCTAKQVEAGLRAMGAEVAAIAALRASQPYPPASKPGESPHVRTGFGGDQIGHEFWPGSMKARVGYRTGATYMIFHELGINYAVAGFQQRPSIVPAFNDNVERIAGIGQAASQRAAAGGPRR